VYKRRDVALLLLLLIGLTPTAQAACTLSQALTFVHSEIGSVPVLRDPTSGAILLASQMQVNTDGAPDSYHPDNLGITHICNGVSVGSTCTWKSNCLAEFRQAKAEQFRGPTKICFFGMATDDDGVPIVQGDSDPKPGYFVPKGYQVHSSRPYLWGFGPRTCLMIPS
jgi:hypothetical protein